MLAEAKRPLILIGQGALARPDGPEVLALAARIATAGARDEGWNGLAVLHTAAARVGALDLGFVPQDGGLDTVGMVAAAATGEIDVLFLLGNDAIDMHALDGAFVVYIGTHGDAGAHRADVILPGAAYTEKSATYVNTEGRVQMTERAGFPARRRARGLGDPACALRSSWPYAALRHARRAARGALRRPPAFHAHRPDRARLARRGEGARREAGKAGGEPFANVIGDFYLTNPIARASAVMAECSALAAGRLATAAE